MKKQIGPRTRFGTIEEWKPHMVKDILEYVERVNMSVEEYHKMRVKVWDDLLLYFDGHSIEDFEEMLEEPGAVSLMSESNFGGGARWVRAPEIRRWIKARLSELKKRMKVEGHEYECDVVWEYERSLDENYNPISIWLTPETNG